MRWTTLVYASAALAVAAPLANAQDVEEPMIAAACYPGADDGAESVGNFYYKQWGRASTRYVEVWQESNGIPGLQLDAGMACGQPADSQRLDACTGLGGCVL